MSTIADYSVFTKAFLASGMTDFSQLYGNKFQDDEVADSLRAFAVIPFNLETPLTPREAMNFDLSKLSNDPTSSRPASDRVSYMARRVSCKDANRNFIGNIVRVQPSTRDGSIRFVAKVAVPDLVTSEDGSNPADAPYNTFVLVRTDASTNIDLPIAVATISKGYNLHRHKVVVTSLNDPYDDKFADPLDDVENANYVSFTINNLNGYTSVDFNPDAYATYDVTDALSHRVDVLEGKEGIEGLHIAFNSNTGDIILSDSKGNVIDQANLHLDLSADTIIAEGEEGYKYVKTNINQNVHSAKAFMAPPGEDGSYTSAFGEDKGKAYNTVNASLVRYAPELSEVCNGIRVRWSGSGQEPHDEIFYVFLKDGDGNGGTESGKKYLAWNSYRLSGSELAQGDPKLFHTASGTPIEVAGDSATAIYSGDPAFSGIAPVYNHDVFVHTVGNSSLGDWDKCFELMGFHDGDDIPLGTDLPALMQKLREGNGYLDPEEFIHGADADNAAKVVEQRERAKDEMVEYNKRRPTLAEERSRGTIIDSSGLDVRAGHITLGCGRIGKEGEFQKVNYGIQMRERFGAGDDHNTYESLDFTVSHHTGKVQFDANGHAAQTGGNGGLVPLTSSTLLSIEANSYISGAPTCLILAKVTRKPKADPPNPEGSPDPTEGSPVLTPIRMTAGFSVEQSYDVSSGLSLTLHDDRDNIAAVFNPNNYKYIPAIIEVQAIYTHPAAIRETVPAQQMHTYIGSWFAESLPSGEQPPHCSFLCNKIEEWMTAIDLTDTDPSPDSFNGVGLYVVIRVY